MIKYHNVVIDVQTLIYDNIDSIISGGTTDQINWNSGQVFDYKSYDEWIEVNISFDETDLIELGSGVNGSYIYGGLRINYYKKNGTNVNGLEVATNIGDLFNGKTKSNNTDIYFNLGKVIHNKIDDDTKYFLTSFYIPFEAKAV